MKRLIVIAKVDCTTAGVDSISRAALRICPGSCGQGPCICIGTFVFREIYGRGRSAAVFALHDVGFLSSRAVSRSFASFVKKRVMLTGDLMRNHGLIRAGVG